MVRLLTILALLLAAPVWGQTPTPTPTPFACVVCEGSGCSSSPQCIDSLSDSVCSDEGDNCFTVSYSTSSSCSTNCNGNMPNPVLGCCNSVALGGCINLGVPQITSDYCTYVGGIFHVDTEFLNGQSCDGDTDRCVTPTPTDCCSPNPGPGCNDPNCMAVICGVDEQCCTEQWDQKCANEASGLCPNVPCRCACAPTLTPTPTVTLTITAGPSPTPTKTRIFTPTRIDTPTRIPTPTRILTPSRTPTH